MFTVSESSKLSIDVKMLIAFVLFVVAMTVSYSKTSSDQQINKKLISQLQVQSKQDNGQLIALNISVHKLDTSIKQLKDDTKEIKEILEYLRRESDK